MDPKYPTYKEPLTQYPTVINHHAFGYGRRMCTGVQVCDHELIVGIGGIAWACNISAKKDVNGRGIPANPTDFSELLITRPEPFAFDIVPRSEKKALQIEENFQDAMRNDPHLSYEQAVAS